MVTSHWWCSVGGIQLRAMSLRVPNTILFLSMWKTLWVRRFMMIEALSISFIVIIIITRSDITPCSKKVGIFILRRPPWCTKDAASTALYETGVNVLISIFTNCVWHLTFFTCGRIFGYVGEENNRAITEVVSRVHPTPSRHCET